MITPPNECFFKIFDYLRFDYKSLYSCLLVNRHWCRIIVPILWSEIATKLSNRKFINTCLSSLNSDEQELLIPFKIILPIYQNQLFEYTSYIKSVCNIDNLDSSFDDLENGVINWLNYNGYEPYCEDWEDDKLVIAVKNSLIAMFLRTCKELKCLKVSGIIYNRVFKNLCRRNNIILLDLVKNHFNSEETKELIEYICKNNTLTTLKISCNFIDSWGEKALAESFCKNTTLTSLIFSGNCIGNEGVKAFVKVLYINTTLTSLNLSSNYINNEGGKAFAEVLYINTTLTFLNLSINYIGDEGGKELAKALYKNTI
ncbi:hypothetical protein C2G38_2164647 [Gigaspora rosea]|uniref:F-box domain-containing protein n=1 Tax=Gigaspora rosea TaxID=44941 RepID=A0A397VTU9_9GLOM|nr:hypothetical protein C2G38_2164647 [Gigaspora rosea]